jgi:formylglycine-generating enzyme required for sulfatase activity
MVWVAPGDFIMGSSDADMTAIARQHPDWRADWFVQEQPQRRVSLPGYWIYRYPVTVAQFQACCEATEWHMPAAPEWGWQADHPMVNVSWSDIMHYAEWAQATIPTEAQWEKAARGTEGNTWPWGNTWMPDYCSHAANTASTQAVNAHPENISVYGACDMVGNVWEWCQAAPIGEYMHAPSRSPQRKAPSASGHVLRGGSWQCAFAAYLRCAYRCFECDVQRGRGTYRRPTVGFRCVVAADV